MDRTKTPQLTWLATGCKSPKKNKTTPPMNSTRMRKHGISTPGEGTAGLDERAVQFLARQQVDHLQRDIKDSSPFRSRQAAITPMRRRKHPAHLEGRALDV
jgi:hypothetical protein